MTYVPTSRIKARPGSSQVKLDIDVDLIRRMRIVSAERGMRLWECYEAAVKRWLKGMEG